MKKFLQKGSWLPDIYEKLCSMIEEYSSFPHTPDPVAVFDLDQTCIRGDIGYTFFYEMVEKFAFHYWFEPFRKFFLQFDPDGQAGQVLKMLEESRGGIRDKNRFMFLIYDILKSIEMEMGEKEVFGWMAGLLLGWKYQEVRRETEYLLEREMKIPLGEKVIAKWGGKVWKVPTGIRIYEEMKNLIEVLQSNGFETWIISATSQPIVETTAKYLGVPSERCIGVKHKIENDVLVSIIEDITYRQGKVNAIDRIIGRRPVLAVGDWETDMDMLDCTEGLSILIDRGNKKLIEYAKEKKWLIQPVFKL